jgi:hypothetical protein
MRGPLRVPLLLATLWAAAAGAHHTFSGIYDSGRTVTLNATVREFQFVHPHPILVVDVRGNAGEPQTWRAEMDNRHELEAIGMTGATFRAGDEVIVSGSPGRNQPNILYLWRLERPADRLLYRQTGGTPSLDKAPR